MAERGIDISTIAGTIEELVSGFIKSILPGDAGDTLSDIISESIKNSLPEEWRRGILSSNMTPEGIYKRNRRARIRLISKHVGEDYQKDNTINRFIDIAKSLQSRSNWLENEGKAYAEKSEEEQAKAYEHAMRERATSHYGTFGKGQIFSWLSNAAGLDDAEATETGLKQTASNIMTHASTRNLNEAVRGGKFLVENLFTGAWSWDKGADGKESTTKGAFDHTKRFDASEWGGMSSSSVATLASELTRSTDFLSGVDANNTLQLKNAAERFRETVRDYAKALEPLKDVFGNDTKKMTALIESMSGRDIAKMSDVAVASMSERIATGIDTGLFNTKELLSMRSGVRSMVSGMKGLSSYNYLSTDAQTLLAAEIKGGSDTPWWRTDAQWNKASQYYATDTANSSGVSHMNKGLVLYARQNNIKLTKENMSETARAFDDAVLKYMEEHKNVDYEHAILGLLGKRHFSELDEASAYAILRHVTVSGVMSPHGLAARAQQEIKDNKDAIIRQTGLSNALSDKSYNYRSSIYDKAMEAVQEDHTILELQDDDAIIQRIRDANENITENEAKDMVKVLNYVREKYASLPDMIVAAGRASAASESVQKTKARRDAFKKAGVELFDKDNGLIFKLASSKMSDVRDTITSSNAIDKIAAALEEDDKEMLNTAASAAILSTRRADSVEGQVVDKGKAAEAAETGSRMMYELIGGTGRNRKQVSEVFSEFTKLHKEYVSLEKSTTETDVKRKEQIEKELHYKAAQIRAYQIADAGDVDAIVKEGNATVAERHKRLDDYMDRMEKGTPAQQELARVIVRSNNIKDVIGTNKDTGDGARVFAVEKEAREAYEKAAQTNTAKQFQQGWLDNALKKASDDDARASALKEVSAELKRTEEDKNPVASMQTWFKDEIAKEKEDTPRKKALQEALAEYENAAKSENKNSYDSWLSTKLKDATRIKEREESLAAAKQYGLVSDTTVKALITDAQEKYEEHITKTTKAGTKTKTFSEFLKDWKQTVKDSPSGAVDLATAYLGNHAESGDNGGLAGNLVEKIEAVITKFSDAVEEVMLFLFNDRAQATTDPSSTVKGADKATTPAPKK